MRGLTTICAVVVMAATTIGLAGCTASDDGDRTTSSSSATARPVGAATPDPGEHLAILHRPFASTDALPDTEVAASTLDSMVQNSQRRAGEHDGTTYWVAAASNGGACLVAVNPDPDSTDNWGMCGGTDVPAADVLVSMDGDDGHRVSLVSDGYTGGGSTALHELVPNVWGN
jgi:hypothetical protein